MKTKLPCGVTVNDITDKSVKSNKSIQDLFESNIVESIVIRFYTQYYNLSENKDWIEFILKITRYINVDVVYNWSLTANSIEVSHGSCDKVYFCEKNNKREITFSYFNGGGGYTCSHSIVIPDSSLIWYDIVNKLNEWNNKDKKS